MGGFTWSSRAWRLKIPKKSVLYGDCVANNFLEFLAMVVTIWLVKIECNQKGLKQECILGLDDNTSAICWLFKTKGIKKVALYHDAVTFVTRNLAELMLSYDHCLASQHIPGKHSTVSNLFSFQGSDWK